MGFAAGFPPYCQTKHKDSDGLVFAQAYFKKVRALARGHLDAHYSENFTHVAAPQAAAAIEEVTDELCGETLEEINSMKAKARGTWEQLVLKTQGLKADLAASAAALDQVKQDLNSAETEKAAAELAARMKELKAELDAAETEKAAAKDKHGELVAHMKKLKAKAASGK